MKEFAKIESGQVVNISVWGADAQPDGWIDVTGLGAGIGDLYDGTTFTRPPEPDPVVTVPVVVSMRQARLALLGAGLLAGVEAAVQAMVGAAGDAARIEWEYAAEVKRSSPLVVSLAASLGLTEAQLDELFVAAAGL